MKLTKRLLAMALAGVMLLTILTGCGGGKSGDRLVEEYLDAFLRGNHGLSDVPITHDVPEIKTVAEMFKTSWLNDDGSWAIPSTDFSPNEERQALKEVFSSYESSCSVELYACEVDSKQNELNQTMRVMSIIHGGGLSVHRFTTTPPTPAPVISAAKCATRLVTRGEKSYRIAVIIYDYAAG